MVLPIILGVLALSAGGFGVSKGIEGADSLGKAQEKLKQSQGKYEKAKKRLDSRIEYVNNEANQYGALQQEIKQEVFVMSMI
jgi:prefoldin subunit 5